jgi:predicted TIM-barrel fold metal-dependent hydrolase
MIVDFHCHAGRGELLDAPWNASAPLAPYLRRANAAGIGLTVIVPPFNLDSGRANREVAGIVAEHPGRLVGFAWIHSRRDRGRVAQLVDDAVGRGLRGIKVHGKDALPTREVCEAARRHRLPILVDVVAQAHPIDLMAPAYPDVAFVVAHLGSFADDWRAHQTVIDQLVRHPNVFADTSGVRRFDYLVQAVRRAGAGKLLFGSDGPWLHPALELEKIRLLGLSRRDADRVMGGNALRLLRATASVAHPRGTGTPRRRAAGPRLRSA